MSRNFKFSIKYNSRYSASNIGMVLRALEAAVAENWREGRDQWSNPAPEPPIDVVDWTDRCDPANLEWSDPPKVHFKHLPAVDYSPLSVWKLGPCVERDLEGRLGVSGYLIDRALSEIQGTREQWRMREQWERKCEALGDPSLDESGPREEDPEYEEWYDKFYALGGTPTVWPQNQRYLHNVIDALKTALPVREFQIDEQLRLSN